jgi:hypothetical protein
MARALTLFHVFRFRVFVGDVHVSTEKLGWEGATLVMTRVMREGLPDLYEEVLKLAPDGKIRVTLETREHRDRVSRAFDAGEPEPPDGVMEWELSYDKVVNRGFDFVNAAVDELAREAVAFVGARMTRVKR